MVRCDVSVLCGVCDVSIDICDECVWCVCVVWCGVM